MASSAPSRPAELTELLDPVVGGAGFVLEKVTVTPAGRRRVVRVVVDLPEDAVGAMSLDQAADVTRAVSTALDDAGAFGEQPYLLEVGSPGVDRPLTEPRHWRRSRTRLVQVDVTGEDGTARRVTGRVVEAGAAGVVLVVDEKGAAERLEVPWERLGTGAVQVEFDRRDAPADEDDDDLDDEPDDDEHDEHDDAHDEDEDEG